MTTDPLQWIDRLGLTHRLRLARDLSIPDRELLTILRQQMGITVRLLEAGYRTPAISQAAPHMMQMMLRILLHTLPTRRSRRSIASRATTS
jgi:hypothetical protein